MSKICCGGFELGEGLELDGKTLKATSGGSGGGDLYMNTVYMKLDNDEDTFFEFNVNFVSSEKMNTIDDVYNCIESYIVEHDSFLNMPAYGVGYVPGVDMGDSGYVYSIKPLEKNGVKSFAIGLLYKGEMKDAFVPVIGDEEEWWNTYYISSVKI